MKQSAGISTSIAHQLKPEHNHQQHWFDVAKRPAVLAWTLKVVVCLVGCLLALPVFAQNPASVVRWNGSLPASAGRTVEVRFALYQDQAGGLALWSETQAVTVDADGRYTVLLGAASAEGLPPALFQAGEPRWIEARPASGGDAAAQPNGAPARSLLAAVPYAFKSVDSETLAGRAAADYVTREDLQSAVAAGAQSAALPRPMTAPNGGGTAGTIPEWTGAETLGNSVISEIGAKIGIDTAAPATTLDVNGAATVRGNLSLPALGTATASGAFSSPVFAMNASSFLAGGAAVNQEFAWEVQAEGSNTSNPSSALSLLYASGGHGVTNTGLSILPNGSFFSTANLTTAAVPATAAAANASPRMYLQGSAWNSTSAKAVQQNFAWSTIPTGNNTASPSANLTLQFSQGTAVPAPTGLSFAPNGIVTFASGQTFPGAGGSGTITGVTATSPLTGGGATGAVTIGLSTSALETTLKGVYAQLGAFNSFTQGSSFGGPLSAATNNSGYGAVFGDGTEGMPGMGGESDTGIGVFGGSITPANGQEGVMGFTSAMYSGTHGSEATSQVAGVWGDTAGNPNPGGHAAGVIGTADNANGGGFYNNSQGNPTVWAQNYSGGGGAGGGPYGLYATISGAGGTAVTGISSGDASEGVSGIAQSGGSDGVYGEADGTVDGKGYVSIGVQGFAKQATGVMGTSVNNSATAYAIRSNGYVAGVWGDTNSAFQASVGGGDGVAAGVMGTADNNLAADFINNSAEYPAIEAYNSSGASGLFKTLMASTPDGACGIGSGGSLSCTGQVKALVSTAAGAHRVETYAPQSPENWMEDYGNGTMERGVALVRIDPGFAETISETPDYHVFITPNGDAEALYVIHKTAAGFEVRESKGGTSSLTFDYKIVARRRGYEAQRLVDVTEPFNVAMKAAGRHTRPGATGTAASVSIRRSHPDLRPPERTAARPQTTETAHPPTIHP
jgi:hypothetical protein